MSAGSSDPPLGLSGLSRERSVSRLLVVDDEKELLAALCDTLPAHGYETVGFGSAREALAALAESEFDLLLTDLMMPEMDGIALLKAALEIDRRLIVVLMTGQATLNTAVDALKAGAFDYVTKPFKLAGILPTLSRAMQMRWLKLENLELRETVAIHDLARAIAFTLDVDTIVNMVTDAALQQCEADEASLMLPSEDGQELIVAAVRGDNRGSVLGQRVAIGHGVAGWVAKSQVPVLLEGAIDDSRFAPLQRRPDIVAAVSIPIMSGGQLMGVLNVSTRRRRPFTIGQVKALSLFTGLAAPVLQNARLHQALRASELNYQLLFKSHPEPLWVYDLETLAFLEVNDAAIERYGYSREEFLAMTIKEIRPPEEVPTLMESLPMPEGLYRSSPGFWIHRAKDGTLIEVEVTSHNVTFGDRQARFVMAQDVTARRRLDQQVGQSQRLESLGQLAGGVAHDFNNLLGVILNFALFVKEKVGAAADGPEGERWQPVLKDVQRIERAAESAARLTHQLLAFARREVVQPRSLDINAVIRELEPLLRRTLGEHIEFVTSLGSGLRPVLIDPGHLEQVLTNLAVNARDAMRVGGTLTIDTENVDVDVAYAVGRAGLKPGRYVRLRVSDTGTGMDKETLQRAFEPFFTTKPKGEGTGLGLATVYGIVTQAGGYISLYSELGLGTRIAVLLPATDQAPQSSESLVSKQSEMAGETVLVVEDAEDLREVVGRILTDAGYRVIVAASGPDAVKAAQAHADHIDLLLTDVVMPHMLGPELAEQIAAMRPGLRVLFMSGYAEPMLGSSGTLEPGVMLIEKPFTAPVLLARVREVLEAKP